MMPPVEGQNQFPSKCPFPSCRSKLYQEWVLGLTPKFIGMVNVVVRCNSCKRVFALTMPVIAVEEFKESLPSDPDFPVKLKRNRKRGGESITSSDIKDFGDSLEGDGAQKMIEAFAVLDEYDALGYFDNDDEDDD
jgi:hypothetical protein